MRQPRPTFRGQLHVFVGVVLIVVILIILFVMFRDPIVTEHEEIKRRTLQEVRAMQFEWSPIETLKDMVSHHASEYVVTMYRMVLHILLTQCERAPLEALFESILSVHYTQRKFPIDIHLEMRCPPVTSPEQQQERDQVDELITSLRWAEGRITGNKGPPIKNIQEYIVNHWLPVTNWEISVFIEEGYVLSHNWFSVMTKAIQHYAISNSQSVIPITKRNNKPWQLSYTVEDLTPKHFLGFSLFHEPSDALNTHCYTVQLLSTGSVLFPAKWHSFREDMKVVNKEALSGKEEIPLNTVVENTLIKNNLALIHLGFTPLMRKWTTKGKGYDVAINFPRLTQLPHFSLAENRILGGKHIFDEDEWL